MRNKNNNTHTNSNNYQKSHNNYKIAIHDATITKAVSEKDAKEKSAVTLAAELACRCSRERSCNLYSCAYQSNYKSFLIIKKKAIIFHHYALDAQNDSMQRTLCGGSAVARGAQQSANSNSQQTVQLHGADSLLRRQRQQLLQQLEL